MAPLYGLSSPQDKLHKSEELFSTLIASVKDYAIIMLDASGAVLSWNAGAKQIYGFDADEILGENFSLFYTKDAADRHFPESELESAKINGRFED